jgi:hypothetical protein
MALSGPKRLKDINDQKDSKTFSRLVRPLRPFSPFGPFFEEVFSALTAVFRVIVTFFEFPRFFANISLSNCRS